MKDLNNPIMYLDRVLVLQKSVGLADKLTVHISVEELRLKFKDEREKKNKPQTIHKQNQSVKRPSPVHCE